MNEAQTINGCQARFISAGRLLISHGVESANATRAIPAQATSCTTDGLKDSAGAPDHLKSNKKGIARATVIPITQNP